MSPISIANDITALTGGVSFSSSLPLNFMSEDARDESNNSNLPPLIGQDLLLDSRKITQHDLSGQMSPLELHAQSGQAQHLSDSPSQECSDTDDMFSFVLSDESAPQGVQPLTVQEKKRIDSGSDETSSTYSTNKAEESNTDLSTKEPATSRRKKRVKRNGPAKITSDFCEICKKSFQNFKRHMRIHTGEKPYSCETCNKRFTQTSSRNAHRRIHTDDKPYSCDICNKRFGRKDIFERHMRTHTDDKPYPCDICNKRFGRIDVLKTHMRIHTDEKLYRCDICGKAFKQNYVKKHMRKMHTPEAAAIKGLHKTAPPQ